jgi:hypothetical protein
MTHSPKFDCEFLHSTTDHITYTDVRGVWVWRYRAKCPMCSFVGPWQTTEMDALRAVGRLGLGSVGSES